MSTSVVRAARILDRLAQSQTPMTLAEIAGELDIPKSTAYTILRDLASESFVTVSSPPAYSIGLKAFEVGSAHLRASGTAGAVAPELAHLTRALNITSHYAVLDGTEVLYLCKEDPPTLGIQLASAIGARLPSHLTAVGKACLAWLEPDYLPGHVELATRGADGQTICMPDLTAELAQIRVQGFATDDAAVGIQCVAAPVFGLTGLKGAIGVSLLRGSAPSLDPVADDVKTAAARATIALGGTTPNHHVLPRIDHADPTSVARR
ncbi:MAG TPA: IclR family transcriptional regulator [Streptosporangiaceae bacterium]